MCQNTVTDISAGPISQNRIPYLKCADDAKLMIQKADLVISNREKCPLQYTGVDVNNAPTQCVAPFNMFMTDATIILKTL